MQCSNLLYTTRAAADIDYYRLRQDLLRSLTVHGPEALGESLPNSSMIWIGFGSGRDPLRQPFTEGCGSHRGDIYSVRLSPIPMSQTLLFRRSDTYQEE